MVVAGLAAAMVPALQAAAVSPAQAGQAPLVPADPPPVTVLTQGADNGNGDIFISPFGDSSTYASGAEIINNAGQVLWFHPVPAVTVRVNPRAGVATLVASDNQPEGLSAASQGNAQTTRNGDLFVGWGALPYFSEFSPSGQLLFNAEFPAGVNSYRAYRAPWFPPGGQGQHG